ncbi:hypothetical protein J7L67_02275 [bacterium]|nr:hypothetical protein [bacterium]
MKSSLLLIIISFIFSLLLTSPANAVQKINMQSGDFYIGKIVEETDNYIYLDTAFGKIEIERSSILSIEYVDDDSSAEDESSGSDSSYDTSTDDLLNESSEPITDLDFFKSKIRMLEARVDLYQKNIELLQNDLDSIKKRALRDAESYKEKIAGLKRQLQEKNASEDKKFDNLIPIEPGKEIYINQKYIKKIKFIIREGIDGYFIRAEYTIYSEIISVEPNFDVYFFSANGLNIAVDSNNLQFNKIPRGYQHIITKGIPLTFPKLYPKFYFIKIKED